MYVFSLFRVLILYIFETCESNRIRALFVTVHQVNFSTCLCFKSIGQCGGCGTSCGELLRVDRKCKNVKGYTLGGRSPESFLDLMAGARQECEVSDTT